MNIRLFIITLISFIGICFDGHALQLSDLNPRNIITKILSATKLSEAQKEQKESEPKVSLAVQQVKTVDKSKSCSQGSCKLVKNRKTNQKKIRKNKKSSKKRRTCSCKKLRHRGGKRKLK
ncbi:MAG TPA: hypothetical protein VJ201_04765 [Candidatus Babeliales bacterium]|nr:hypothetical protein [Candidatus Babeliales bacterium]